MRLVLVQLNDAHSERGQAGGQAGGHAFLQKKEALRVADVQLKPEHGVQRHGVRVGVVHLVRVDDEQVASGQIVALFTHGKVDAALGKIGELKTILVIMLLQRGNCLLRMVLAEHPDAGNFQFLLRKDDAPVGVFRMVDPVDGHPFSSPLGRKPSILYYIRY